MVCRCKYRIIGSYYGNMYVSITSMDMCIVMFQFEEDRNNGGTVGGKEPKVCVGVCVGVRGTSGGEVGGGVWCGGARAWVVVEQGETWVHLLLLLPLCPRTLRPCVCFVWV